MSEKKTAEIIQLYRESSPELLAVLQRKLGNRMEAEEVAQDAFEKLCDLSNYDDVEDLRRYFFTMANRLALNLLRRRRIERGYLTGQYGSVDQEQDLDPEVVLYHRQKLDRTRAALMGLPAKTREIFLMHRFQGRTYLEIAREFRLSIKSIEYHMNKALKAVVQAAEEV
ncbi:MAG: RNA polymerase sigma factor [Pseudomonadota bacterium]